MIVAKKSDYEAINVGESGGYDLLASYPCSPLYFYLRNE